MDGVVEHIENWKVLHEGWLDRMYFVLWSVIMNSTFLDLLIKEIEFLFQKRKKKNELKTWF